jgi:hypothetical protein
MQETRRTVSARRHGEHVDVPLATFTRPVDAATVADLGLSIEEGRHLLGSQQQTIAQSQIHAYDSARRRCRHCRAYRRLKDWQGRVVSATPG